jgi:hypothetical protein
VFAVTVPESVGEFDLTIVPVVGISSATLLEFQHKL